MENRQESGTNGQSEAAHSAMEKVSDKHLHMLRVESSISDEVIAARGYRTVTDPRELEDYGFARYQRRPGLLIPVHTTDGGVGPYILRPDRPRTSRRRGEPRTIKYETPKGAGLRIDVPPLCQSDLGDPNSRLWITEGQKKADALASRGQCAIDLLGVWGWKGKNDKGGTTFLADWDHIALKGRDVILVYDSDVMTKESVRDAVDRLAEHLRRKGARVRVAYLPEGEDGKTGVDDYLAGGHTLEDLERLLGPLQPRAGPEETTYTWLDAPPPAMTRYLVLVDGRAYAATWIDMRVERRTREKRENGKTRLGPVEVTYERKLIVVRDDGTVFGLGGDEPLSALDMKVDLEEIGAPSTIWSREGVSAFRKGQHPDPREVYERIVDGVDAFMDFRHSLSDQRTVCEFLACHIMSTYLLETLPVTGYIWASGLHGNGKTVLITVHASLAYLGLVVTSNSTTPTLRDMASYGATLAIDDAEKIASAYADDPNRRTLLLASNRRGAAVLLKEVDGNRGWRTRYVDAYATRVFSAIGLPDPVLGSRAILVPLVRTHDKVKANREPEIEAHWPHPPRALVDDLWALGVRHLPQMGTYYQEAIDHARLMGRPLEPWQGVLTVARWLEAHGVEGVYERMERLAYQYAQGREKVERVDPARLVARALGHCAISAISTDGKVEVAVGDVTERVMEIAEEEDIDLGWEEKSARRRVGRLLHRLGLERAPRPGGKGSRRWRMEKDDLIQLLTAYDIPIPTTVSSLLSIDPPPNGTSGTMAHPTPLEQFLAQRTERAGRVHQIALYTAYARWCREGGVEPPEIDDWNQAMTALGYAKEGEDWVGLRLLE